MREMGANTGLIFAGLACFGRASPRTKANWRFTTATAPIKPKHLYLQSAESGE